tara:strand:+ start:4001 stop:4885 length:885 start_codon:yes stop_codon:yes gene_type:complete
MQHVVLIGGSGYVGQAFQEVLERRGLSFRNISRSDVDYYHHKNLKEVLISEKPDFLINAAGYTGKPNVDACEEDKTNCLLGNAILPGIIREVCEDLTLSWGHISSGCIYTSKGTDGAPFVEEDEPNFSFRTNNCSFYSGTKALGEEILAGAENCFVWRLRIPFDERNNRRNYLTKLLTYDRLLDAENSISHRFEFVNACLDCFAKEIPFGTYNMTNLGSITAREITEIMKSHGLVDKELQFFENEEEFMDQTAKAPRSNCTMSSEKLRKVGIQMREVHEAVNSACTNWVVEELV